MEALLTSNKVDRSKKDRGEFSLYVKGIVNGMNKSALDKAFRTFGTVIKLDVVPTKSCAFVEFDTKEAYQRALVQKSIEIPGLGIVTVEERKQKNRNFHQVDKDARGVVPTPGLETVTAVTVAGRKQKNRNFHQDLETVTAVTVSERKPKNRNFHQVDEDAKGKKGRGTVNRELSLYVKGIVDGMNKSVIDKAFRTFGTVMNLDVVPTKSCAFVEFGTKEAYQRALMQKSIEIPGFGIVTVEERKQKNQNQNYQRRNPYRHYLP